MSSGTLGQSESPEELVYAAAILILSSDLYPRKLEVIREYIQNASDALDSFAYIGNWLHDSTTPQIKVSIQGRSLLIWDNGLGMDAQDIEKLKRVAYSEKKAGAEAGYKGIGRLAGIAVAQKLLISSTSYGDSLLHKFEFRASDFQADIADKRQKGEQEPASEVIKRHTSITQYDVDPQEHYTLVELREIDERYPDLLQPEILSEFIGEIAPVGFSPQFQFSNAIESKLVENVPDYSPKVIWLTSPEGDRKQVFKPYTAEIGLAEPEYLEVCDPTDRGRVLAFCWYATKGKELRGKWRAAGGKITVAGKTPSEKKRLAGITYKLFGFSIGDRSLPLRTLWRKDYTRPLWFTGEIHIIDKGILPTTDRSDFVDNEARRALYVAGQEIVALKLNRRAQEISDIRQSIEIGERHKKRLTELEQQLTKGLIERANLKAVKTELHEAREDLNRRCKDTEVRGFLDSVSRDLGNFQQRLVSQQNGKLHNNEINDLAKDLGLTSQARKVYQIIMDSISRYFRDDKDTYFDLSAQIHSELKRKI
jgi:hypothetical protein